MSQTSYALSEHCAYDHIKEAMEINRSHRTLYKEGDKKSAVKIINRLIFLEKIMLPFSRKLDRSTKKLVSAGFPMWCEDFVSMDNLPDFQINSDIPSTTYASLDKDTFNEITKSLKAYEFNHSSKLYSKIVFVLDTKLNDHHYNCLTRHFLESIARSLKLSIERRPYITKEFERDFFKANKLMMKQMRLALIFVRGLDKRASNVQAQGTPVLCQEMPIIPY
tara:strand:- start:634 stop:1296 length:663 start_codon:yes stop_codon:yes gene_type:complete